jgi:PKD repeat protein
MTAHLRAIGVLMALCLVAALAGAMSGCGGGNAPGTLNASSVHTPHVTGHAGQVHYNQNDPTAPVNGSALKNWRNNRSLTDVNTPTGPVATNPVRSASMAGELAELDAMPVPAGADPRVWAQLKSLFRRMLLSGAVKTVSSPPTSNLSKVNDLAATGDTTSGTFTWTYRSQGDYNQDRLVNAQDLAPLGIHWGKTSTAADWNIARAADGDANGTIGIGDLSPIGANFAKDTAGYHLQYSADGTTGWAQVADSPWVESAIADGLRVFTHILAPAQAGFYRVLPYDATSVEGIASDALQFPTTTGNPPVAVLTATPSSGDPPLNVLLDGGGSSDPDAGDFITKYEFDFGDPAGTWVDNGTGSSLSHTYNAVGIYTATLRVTDNNGNTDTDSKQITVGTQPDLFTQALTGVTLAATDLNFSYITEPITFGDTVTNYGWDVAQFDSDGAGTMVGVPGSRFGAFTSYWHDDHTQLPVWSKGFTDSVDAAGNIESLIKAANDKFFEGDSRQTYYAATLPVPGTDYTPAPTDPLATAVINLINNNGGSADAPAITTDGADVPLGLQNVLSEVLQAADAAGVAIQASKTTFFGAYDPSVDPSIWSIAYDHSYTFRVPVTAAYLWSFRLFGLDSTDGGTTWTVTNTPYCDVLDYPTYAQAAINLAHALDQANALLSSGTVSGTFSFDQVTPIGRILINSGGGDTTYTQTEDPIDPSGYYLLICDVDGNDTYNCNAGANGNMFNPVSICLDLAGNDTYAALDDPADTNGLGDDMHSQQGAGRWGVGYLIDYAGSDTYTTSQAGQGFGVAGWGLLYDKAGSDTYEGVDFVQGAALLGVGILYDEVGVDSYHAGGSAQGYGDIWGIGLLTDKGSDADTYFAEWDTTHVPAYFGYAQGAAAGFLGLDATTMTMPINLDGGIGALVESGGDDTYTSFARSQGCGYDWSTGILDDRAGNDTYETDAIGQGSALLFGTGILMDRAGNDKYNTAQATRGFPLENYTLGGCVNRSVAWFLDGGGSDEYTEQSFGLGTGAINSFAFFCDMGVGADKYSIPLNADDNEKTLGRGYLDPDLTIADGATNESNVTFGLFIDCGGADTYDAKYADIPTGSIPNVSAGDDKGWFRFGYTNDVPNQFRLNEFGTGLDGSGIVGFEFP